MGRYRRGQSRTVAKKNNAKREAQKRTESRFLTSDDDVCVICSHPLNSVSNEEENEADFLAMIRFVSVDCLGLGDVNEGGNGHGDEIKTEKMSSGKRFCDEHFQLVRKGQRLKELIQRTMEELAMVKTTIRKVVKRSRRNLDGVNCFGDNNSEFGAAFQKKDDAPDEYKIGNVEDVEFDFCEIGPLSEEPDADVETLEREFKPEPEKEYQKEQFISTPDYQEPISPPPVRDEIDGKRQRFPRRAKRRMENPSESANNNYSGVEMDHDNHPEIKQEDPDCETEGVIPFDDDKEIKLEEVSDSEWNEAPPTKRRKRQVIKSPTKSVSNQRKGKKSAVRTPKVAAPRMRTTKRFSCCVCRKSFDTIPERNSHQLLEHGPGPYFPCNLCTKSYFHHYRLKCHMIRSHTTERTSFPCDECGKIFRSNENMKVHKRKRHSADSSKILTCPHCTKKYKGPVNLYAHIRTFHTDGKGLLRKHLVCEFCGKAYSDPQQFRQHKDKVHLNIQHCSVCDICGKKLSDPKSLQKHKLSQHNKAYQFRCELCGAGCLFKSHLIAHFKSKHSSLSEEEITEWLENSKKVLDNTNPIYRQGEEEQRDLVDEPNSTQILVQEDLTVPTDLSVDQFV